MINSIRPLALAAIAILPIALGVRERAPSLVAAAQEHPESTLENQVDVSLTVYNSDLALVRDIRRIAIPRGQFDLRFVDIASSINQATVHFRSLTEPQRLRVLEQNYEYDLLEPQKLFQKYVGRELTLVRLLHDEGQTRTEQIKATLIANNNGPIFKIGDEIVTGLHPDHVRFTELPENLYSRPTLVWMLENTGGNEHRIEASYLAQQIRWNADYVLTVSRDDKLADLDGWVTLTNNSGTAFRNARLQLVAGDLNRVREQLARKGRDEVSYNAAASPPPFAEESFAEYHLYNLGRRTSVSNNETKQLSLLSGTGVRTQKTFVVEGQQVYYHNAQHPGTPLKGVVKVLMTFKNEQASGLGVPMPAGVIRVYQADANGGIQFVGEDRIGHTPKDESISLHVGNAFDVVCERAQTDFQKISSSTHEVAFEITLKNHKDQAITVEVNEPIAGDWQMLNSSHKWTKTAAWAARFDVPVPANGDATLTFRARIRR